jgi:hypothetical protein
MTPAQLLALLETARWIQANAPSWINNFRAKGELTPEMEAAYQAHQKAIFDKPEMQLKEGE